MFKNLRVEKEHDDTLCAIGGGIAEEFCYGTGSDEDGLLQRYLDEYLYQIVKN